MAKVGFWLQGAKGKLAGSVMQKGEGGTIIRQRVAPNNPKTPKQMAQRIVFATVTQAARFMDPIINHSFEGFATGAKSRREFVRLNLDKLRALAALDFADAPSAGDANVFMTTKNVSALIPNRYIVSRGSLSYNNNISLNRVSNGGVGTIQGSINVVLNTTLSSTQTEGYVTLGELMSKLCNIDTVNTQLTLLTIETNASQSPIFTYVNAPGGVIRECTMSARRIVLRSDVDLSQEVKVVAIENGNPVLQRDIHEAIINAVDLSKTDVTFVDSLVSYLSPSYSNQGTIALSGQMPLPASTLAAGLIRSKLVGDSWLRSSCELTCAAPSDLNWGLTWNYAGDAWSQSVELAASTQFLEKGQETGSIDV